MHSASRYSESRARRALRHLLRKAIALCLAVTVGLPVPLARGGELRAQPANVPQLNTPQFSSADLQPYLDQANQAADQAGWESIVASARTALAASWEAGIDAQINGAVSAVTEQDIFNSTAEYQEYVRGSLNIQKAEAFGQWELAMSAAIENGRSARLGAGTGADLDEAERITASSLSDAERQKLEEITRTQKEWEERFLSEMQKSGAEFNAGMQALLSDYNSVLSEIAQKDQEFNQQKALIESYEQVVRNSIQGSLSGLEQLLTNGAMFHAESCDAQNVCSVDMGALNAEGQSLQNLIDTLRNGLQTDAPLSSLVQQMGDYMRAQEENARLRAEYWQGQVYTTVRTTPPGNSLPVVIGLPMPPAGPMAGNALWEIEEWYAGNQAPLRQYLAGGSHKTAVDISGVDICGMTPAAAMWSSFPLTLSISDAGDCRSGGVDPYTYIAGSAIFWAGFALPVWQHFPEWQVSLHVTHRLHDGNAEHNASVWNGYRNSLTPVANSWSGELLDAVSSWETQVAEFNAAHSAWQAEAAAQQAQAQQALAQGQLELSQLRDQWLQEQRRLYEDGKRRFDVLKDTARSGGDTGDLTNIAMPGPTAAPSAAEFAAIRNEFRSALPSAEERSLNDLSSVKPDLENLKKVANGFQSSFTGIRNLAIASALDSQSIQQQEKATAQLVSALEGVQIGIEGVSGFTVTQDESGRIVATRSVHSGQAVVRAGTEGTSASDYDAVMTTQTIALEKAAAAKQTAGGDLFTRWDFNEYMASHQANLQAAAEVRNDTFAIASEVIKSAQEEAANRYKAFMADAEGQASARATIKAILESYVQSVLGGMSTSQAIGSAIQGQVRSMVAGAIAEATGLPASFIAAVLGGAKPHQAAMQWLEGEMWSTFETEMSKATGLPLNGVLSTLWKQNEAKKAARAAKQEKMVKTGVMIVGAVAAPFTGGASLVAASAAIGAYDGYKAGGLQGAVVSAVGGVANYYVGAATGGAVSVGLSWDPENGFGGSVGVGRGGAQVTLSASEHGGYGLSAGIGGDGFGVTASAHWEKGGQFTGASVDLGYEDLDLDFGLDYSPGQGLTGSLNVGGYAELDWSQNGGFTGTASIPFEGENGEQLGALTWNDEDGFGGAFNVADGASVGWTQGSGFFGEIDLAAITGDNANDVGAPDLDLGGTLSFSQEGGFEAALGLGDLQLTASDQGIGVSADIEGIGTIGYDPEKGFTAEFDIPDLNPDFDPAVGFSGEGDGGSFEISYGPDGLTYGFEAPDTDFMGMELADFGYDSEKGLTGTLGIDGLLNCDVANGRCNSPAVEEIRDAINDVADTVKEIQQDIAQIGTDLENMVDDLQNWNPIEYAFGDELAAIEELGNLQLSDLWDQDAFEEWALEEAEDFLDDYTGPVEGIVGIGGVIDPNNPYPSLPPGWDDPWGDDEDDTAGTQPTPEGEEPEGEEPEGEEPEGEEPEGEEPEVAERQVRADRANEASAVESKLLGNVPLTQAERQEILNQLIAWDPARPSLSELVTRIDTVEARRGGYTAINQLLDDCFDSENSQDPNDCGVIIRARLASGSQAVRRRALQYADWRSDDLDIAPVLATLDEMARIRPASKSKLYMRELVALLRDPDPIALGDMIQEVDRVGLMESAAGLDLLYQQWFLANADEAALQLGVLFQKSRAAHDTIGIRQVVAALQASQNLPAQDREKIELKLAAKMQDEAFARMHGILMGSAREDDRAIAVETRALLLRLEGLRADIGTAGSPQLSDAEVGAASAAKVVFDTRSNNSPEQPYVRARNGVLTRTIGGVVETMKPLPNGLIERTKRDSGKPAITYYTTAESDRVSPVFATGATRDRVAYAVSRMAELTEAAESMFGTEVETSEIAAGRIGEFIANHSRLARQQGETAIAAQNRVMKELRMISESLVFADNDARQLYLAEIASIIATNSPFAGTPYNNGGTALFDQHGQPTNYGGLDCSRFITAAMYAAGVTHDDQTTAGDTLNINNYNQYNQPLPAGHRFTPSGPIWPPEEPIVNGPMYLRQNDNMLQEVAGGLGNIGPGTVIFQRTPLETIYQRQSAANQVRYGTEFGIYPWNDQNFDSTGHVFMALGPPKRDAEGRLYVDVAEAGGRTRETGPSRTAKAVYYLEVEGTSQLRQDLVAYNLAPGFNKGQVK